MFRLTPVLIMLSAGCTGGEKIGPEQIASLLQSKSGLFAIRLDVCREVAEPPHTEYAGTGRDSDGNEYDIRADVTREAVYWRARRKLGTLTKSEAEAAVRDHFGRPGVLLQFNAGCYRTDYVDGGGQRFHFSVTESTPILSQDAGIEIIVVDADGSIAENKFVPYPWRSGDFEL